MSESHFSSLVYIKPMLRSPSSAKSNQHNDDVLF